MRWCTTSAAPSPSSRTEPTPFGGTLTSRLYRVPHETKGYTYGVRAFCQVLRSAPDGSGASMRPAQPAATPSRPSRRPTPAPFRWR